MQVEGDKVILRRVMASDVTAEYVAWLNDEEVIRGLETVARPYTREMLEQYIQSVLANENTYMFMVLDKATGKTIGTAKVHNISGKNGTCNLGMMIGDKNYWGKGYGQDTYNTAIAFAFNTLGIRKIWEMANANNTASLSMCKKAGFQEEGRLKEHTFSEGKYIDKIVLGLFARDWKK